MVLQSEIPATEGRSSRHERCSFLGSTIAGDSWSEPKPLARRNGGLIMYNRYSASVRAEIGRYASRHGVAAAAHYFSKKLDSLICKRSYGFVPPQRTCSSRSVALPHILSISCLTDFMINVIATNTQSSSVLVHLVFVHDKFSRWTLR